MSDIAVVPELTEEAQRSGRQSPRGCILTTKFEVATLERRVQ